jgi:hypothetical protein
MSSIYSNKKEKPIQTSRAGVIKCNGGAMSDSSAVYNLSSLCAYR